MIAHCSLESWMVESDPLYVFLPLALAGFATAIIFGIQLLLGGFPVTAKVPSNANHSQKGASQ